MIAFFSYDEKISKRKSYISEISVELLLPSLNLAALITTPHRRDRHKGARGAGDAWRAGPGKAGGGGGERRGGGPHEVYTPRRDRRPRTHTEPPLTTPLYGN